MAPVNLIVYPPKNKDQKEELAKRVSHIHASMVIRRLNTLNCPAQQKTDLLNAVIKRTKERSREQT